MNRRRRRTRQLTGRVTMPPIHETPALAEERRRSDAQRCANKWRARRSGNARRVVVVLMLGGKVATQRERQPDLAVDDTDQRLEDSQGQQEQERERRPIAA